MIADFHSDKGAITAKRAIILPVYRDAPAGAEWLLTESCVELTLPQEQWTHEMMMTTDIESYRYERATVAGRLGWKLTKLSPRSSA